MAACFGPLFRRGAVDLFAMEKITTEIAGALPSA
jgi:hypothetical protein